MAKISSQVQIDVPTSNVWNILSDFGNISKWAPLVAKSASTSPSQRGAGSERSCEINMLGNVTEKAVEWDEGSSMKIEVKGIPSVNSMFNTWSLKGEADHSVLSSEVDVEVAGNEEQRKGFEDQLQGVVQLTLQGLKQYAETGEKMAPPPMP